MGNKTSIKIQDLPMPNTQNLKYELEQKMMKELEEDLDAMENSKQCTETHKSDYKPGSCFSKNKYILNTIDEETVYNTTLTKDVYEK